MHRCLPGLALLLPLAGRAVATEPPGDGSAVERVLTDRDQELVSAPAGPLPVLGPQAALVTVDLLQPLGAPVAAQNVALALRVAREVPGVRLVYHPVPIGPAGERGAEVAWEALAQRRLWAVCERLYQRADLLLPEREAALLEEAAQLGLDRGRLREALAQRQHRGRVQELWRRDRDAGAQPPELWVNGRRLAAAVKEIDLRDEIERQRERAQALRRAGVPLSQVYDRLLQQERERSMAWLRMRAISHSAARPPPRTRIDVGRSPTRGPGVAPVTLVLFASLEAASTRGLAELARGVLERHPGRVRLVVKHLPTGYAGQQAAWYLAQLQLRSQELFWRGYEGLLNAVGRRFHLSAREVQQVLRDLKLPIEGLPPSPVPGPALTLLESDRATAKRLELDSAPALAVNGLVLRGGLTAESLDELVRRELEMGVLERLRQAR